MTLERFFAAGRWGDGVALLAGALLTAAFAPFHWFLLAVISPAILLCTWLPVNAERAFYRGWLYGLGLFGTGIYWVYISIHTYGHASVILSLVIALGLINIVALFPAVSGFLLNKYFPQPTWYKTIFAFPAIWVLWEWVRSWVFTGFPWLSLGYSQNDSYLAGYAPLFSIYGLSLAVLVTAGLCVDAGRELAVSHFRPVYRNAAIIAVIWLTGLGFSLVTWTQAFEKPLTVTLVQGDIPQDVKWSPSAIKPTLDRYEALSLPHWQSSDIIIWPEGAIPVPLQYTERYLDKIHNITAAQHNTFITGIPIQAKQGGYYNAVVSLGANFGMYLKNRLVPFGEFIPYASVLNRLLTSLNIPMSDFVPGYTATEITPTKVLAANNVNIYPFICYEIAFPEQVNTPRSDIHVLLTVSNDAWFGHSIAQAQHLQIAQMRALEMQRPVLFVSNNGITAIIAANGHIQQTIPPFTAAALTGTVQPRQGQTPWQQSGLDPLLAIIFAMLVYALRLKRNHLAATKAKPTPPEAVQSHE